MEPTLQDRFGRKIRYLRLSVTDRCDLRCSYCLPRGYRDFETPDHWLTFDEIERLVAAFARLGVERIRLTGGEPLVRKGIADLAARLTALPGVEDLSLSTNATRMEKFADKLFRAGVGRINVSLDSLQPARFKAITGGSLDKVIRGIMAAKTAGIDPIKLNMVVMRGVNDDEAEDMVEFCIEHGLTLRFIETMPMGETGRHASDQYLDLREIRQRLAQRFELVPGVMPGGGPARYEQVVGTDLKVGFITPISQHFCATCNRVRLAADGTLYLCLGQEHKYEFRPLLRGNAPDKALEDAILHAIELKPEQHEFREKPGQVMRYMAMTGG